MSSVVICEKSSQARNIEAAIGAQYGTVLPASGHLFALAEPDGYDPAWKRWDGVTVYRPKNWRKVPTEGRDAKDSKRVKQLRDAISSALRKATTVYIATDADREGEVIGREILQECGYTGKALRVRFSSEDAASIKAAFAAAVPVSEVEHIYQAGLARERADFIFNFSLTRAATTALVEPGARAVIGVGRVKTPTMGIVCRREHQITNFKTAKTYGVKVTVTTPKGPVVLKTGKDTVFASSVEAEAFAKTIPATLYLDAAAKDEKRKPPKPADLAELQARAGKWGWPADKTLDVGQALYGSHKIMTYVRASARYYPEAMIGDVPKILSELRTVPALQNVIPARPEIRAGKSGAFSDEGLKGESHHALAPNPNGIDGLAALVGRLPADDARLFELMAKLFVQTVSPDHEYRVHQATAKAGDTELSASHNETLVTGWKAVFGAEGEESDPAKNEPEGPTEALIGLASDSYPVSQAEAFERVSNPPQPYTHGTLIQAMVNAGQFVADPERRKRLKDAKGIGTAATRGEVIDGLFRQELLTTVKGKVRPTKAGMALFAVLYRVDPGIVDPGTTADWELQIDEIARGDRSLDSFLDAIEAEAGRLVALLAKEPPKAVFGKPNAPSEKMARAVKAVEKATGTKAPAGWDANFSVAKAFLDAHPRQTV